ncbi:unnamed protein product [Clonostachys byssicola]|uniref:Stress response protein NST1 n=1 Tax=Clonostachys byssicola TaxID=160290 RepID=A0A9N9U3A7_9HYPO|nr:unnamed protein product [Clonostachys byssicola]
MPTNHQKQAAHAPASPRNTSKYTNKDGSKFITVPKGAAAESSQPSTPTSNKPSESLPESTSHNSPMQTVNRKKQKRRQKAAAKAAAEQQIVNGHTNRSSQSRPSRPEPVDYEDVNSEDDEGYEYEVAHDVTNGHPQQPLKSKKTKKKKKKKGPSGPDDHDALPSRVRSPGMQARGSGMSRDKIWSTSNQEERERIKEFWLGLGEDERKSLVKVEKDAVLKKMKEQQKHTCSCTVCGRKRTAIEEELETLYDAYYLELEQFANQGDGPPILASTRDFSSHPFRNMHSQYPPQSPSHGRIVEHVGEEDDDDLEEVYSEDEGDDEEYSDDEPPEEYHNPPDRDVADFLTFGNSLQVKGTQLLESLLHRYGNMDLGGILTVADDLLKNDGKRFIEMMEQLAERRMAREEDAREHFSRGYGHPNGSYSNPHNHPSPEDDDYEEEEEEEEEDYDDSQDEEYEDEEVLSNPSMLPSRSHTECCCQDPMTEEQRMEEGRRMFQIFAARMFEQRVLSAYKEKVAKERQAKLIEELEEEDRKEDEQKAKKAKNAQKKKEKAAQKKQAAAEEKARKEAEKAAEEAARIESEQRRASEQRRKAEEKRRQKEAQKKAEEEARLKKEADRQRRIHEQREKQAEQERKARESKDREKKLKEDQRLKEKEAREQKEREALERKEKQERDKREKEARAKAQREAQDARERAKEERAKEEAIPSKPSSVQPSLTSPHQAQLSPSISKRTPQPPISIPTVLPQHPPNPSAFASPKVPVATPAMSKVPTPIRSRALSQQPDVPHLSSATSQSGSGASQNPSPHPDSTTHSSPRPIGQQRKESVSFTSPLPPSSPHSVQSSRPSISTPVQGLLPLAMQPPPGLAHHGPPPGFPSRMGHEQMLPPGFRPGPNMMIPPPGINGPGGRGFSPVPLPPPGFAQTPDFPIGQGFPMPKDPSPPHHTHVRQGSAGFDSASSVPAQPIGRPAPIGRPGSIAQGRSGDDKDDETQHLGSRALLGDDEPIAPEVGPSSLRNQPPGPRQGGFGPNPFLDTGFGLNHNPWGPPSGAGHHFPPPPGLSGPTWGPPGIPPPFAMPSPASAMSPIRSNPTGNLHLRPLLVQLYKDLSNTSHVDSEGYINLRLFKVHLEAQQGDAPHDQDLFDYLENDNGSGIGGGKFELRIAHGSPMVRWSAANDVPSPPSWPLGAAGALGSPVAGPASLRGI